MKFKAIYIYVCNVFIIFAKLNVGFEYELCNLMDNEDCRRKYAFTRKIILTIEEKIAAEIEKKEEKITEKLKSIDLNKEYLKDFNEFLYNNVNKVFNKVIFLSKIKKVENDFDLYFYLIVNEKYEAINRYGDREKEIDECKKFFHLGLLSIHEDFKFKNDDNVYKYNCTDNNFLKNLEECLSDTIKIDKLKERNLSYNLCEFLCSLNKYFLDTYADGYIEKIIKKEYCKEPEINVNFNNGQLDIQILYYLNKNIPKYRKVEVEFDCNTVFIDMYNLRFDYDRYTLDNLKTCTFDIEENCLNVDTLKKKLKDELKFYYFKNYKLEVLKDCEKYKISGFYSIDNDLNKTKEIFNEFLKLNYAQHKYFEYPKSYKEYKNNIYVYFNKYANYYNIMKKYFEEKDSTDGKYLELFTVEQDSIAAKFYKAYLKHTFYNLFEEKIKQDISIFIKSDNFIEKHNDIVYNYSSECNEEKKSEYIKIIKSEFLETIDKKYKFNETVKEIFNEIKINEICLQAEEKEIYIFKFFDIESDVLDKYDELIKKKNNKIKINNFINLENTKKALQNIFNHENIKIDCNKIIDILYKGNDGRYYSIFNNGVDIKNIKKYYLLFSKECYHGFDCFGCYKKLIKENLLDVFINNKKIDKKITDENSIDIIFRKLKILEKFEYFKDDFGIFYSLLYYEENDQNLKKEIDKFIFDIFVINYALFCSFPVKEYIAEEYYRDLEDRDWYDYSNYKKFLVQFLNKYNDKIKNSKNININIKEYLMLNDKNKFYNLNDQEILKYIESININKTKFINLRRLKNFDLYRQVLNYLKKFQPVYSKYEKEINDFYITDLNTNLYFNELFHHISNGKKINEIDFEYINSFKLENLNSEIQCEIPCGIKIKENYTTFKCFYKIFHYKNIKKSYDTLKYFNKYIDDKNEIENIIQEYRNNVNIKKKGKIIKDIQKKINIYKDNLNIYKNNGIKDDMKKRIKILEHIMEKHERIKDNIVLQNKEILKNLKEKIILNNSLDENFKVKINKEISDLLSKVGITDITKIDIDKINDNKLKNLGKVDFLTDFFYDVDKHKKLYDENKNTDDGQEELYNENKKSGKKNENVKSEYSDTNIMKSKKNNTLNENNGKSIFKNIDHRKTYEKFKENKSSIESSKDTNKGGCCCKGGCKCCRGNTRR